MFLRTVVEYGPCSQEVAQSGSRCIPNGKRNALIYTGYLKFIYVSKINSFSHRKSANIYKIKNDIQTDDSFDYTIDFPSLLM